MSEQYVTAFVEESKAMLARAEKALTPFPFAMGVTTGLREALHIQQKDAFAHGGAGKSWAALSEWRVRDRNGIGEPILVATGSFQQQVAAFRGDLVFGADSFDFVYPGTGEADGRYFGLTAGQRRNPLAQKSVRPGPRGGTTGQHDRPYPMKTVPRPILFGEERLLVDANLVITNYLRSFGFNTNTLEG